MESIAFEDVVKEWPGMPPALDHVNLEIRANEFFSIVGPSGCGKTTALRVLAGLEQPTRGTVRHGSRNITELESRLRHFGLVTQQNQLMNHLSTGGNIGFALKLRPRRGKERELDIVRSEADEFGIGHLLDKQPKTLSEGERRLAQLARAVVSSPSTLLLDEPLGFLEDRTKRIVRSAIMRIHRERGLTSLMATASQHDAMIMSDRIAVLFDGYVEQVGTPEDIYFRPVTARVATFFGEPAMGIHTGHVRRSGANVVIDVLGTTLIVRSEALTRRVGSEVSIGVRPHDVQVGVAHDSGITGVVRSFEMLEGIAHAHLDVGGGRSLACAMGNRVPRIGMEIDVALPPGRIHVFDPATGLAIHHPT